jgi:hypothetical protein
MRMLYCHRRSPGFLVVGGGFKSQVSGAPGALGVASNRLSLENSGNVGGPDWRRVG